MSDNRVLSKNACTVCGRLGDPHADWCAETRERLRLEDLHYTEQLSAVGAWEGES